MVGSWAPSLGTGFESPTAVQVTMEGVAPPGRGVPRHSPGAGTFLCRVGAAMAKLLIKQYLHGPESFVLLDDDGEEVPIMVRSFSITGDAESRQTRVRLDVIAEVEVEVSAEDVEHRRSRIRARNAEELVASLRSFMESQNYFGQLGEAALVLVRHVEAELMGPRDS